MPELPEVETVCQGLALQLQQQQLSAVTLRRPNLRYPLPYMMSERLVGATVVGITRRAKLILIHLDNNLTWVMHLGMSGRIHTIDGAQPGKHDHVLIETEQGLCLAFNDPRRFGYMDLVPTPALAASSHFKTLGFEPFDESLTVDVAYHLFKRRSRPIKIALLDQQLIVGLGNIYVAESLWRSGIHPARSCDTLTLTNWQSLLPAIRDVLTAAIAAGGSSLKDYRQVNGELGYFQHSFSVYNCEGCPCQKADCHGTIRKVVQAGRSTFFCASCQR